MKSNKSFKSNNDSQVRLFSIVHKEGSKKFYSFFLAWVYQDKFYYQCIKVPFVASLGYFIGRSTSVENVDDMKRYFSM